MKRNLIFGLLLLSASIFAQVTTSGKIKYKETIKMNLKVDNDSPVAKMLPSSHNVEKILFFNTKEALYTNKGIAKDETIENNEGGAQIKMVFKIPETAMYSNLEGKTFVNETFIADKQFLVSDKIEPYKWQITGEQKIILDLPCQKATYMDDEKEIIAWFTPRIPVSIGPNDLFGLPGLVLLAEYPKLNRAIIAEKITELAPDFVFTIPKDGKKVKKAEFDKIKAEKDKEMKMNGGPGIKIITETRSN